MTWRHQASVYSCTFTRASVTGSGRQSSPLLLTAARRYRKKNDVAHTLRFFFPFHFPGGQNLKRPTHPVKELMLSTRSIPGGPGGNEPSSEPNSSPAAPLLVLVVTSVGESSGVGTLLGPETFELMPPVSESRS